MTKARQELVSLGDTSWYHLVNRCVRRAYLCGVDSISGNDYEHRRGWIETRIMQLSDVFAVDVAAYAVMSNHYHVVVRVDEQKALDWSREEVLQRWTLLFAGHQSVQRYLALDNEEPSESLLSQVDELVEVYRLRLFDLSWFMRVLNESIARMANKEDGVKGHFWEGRFKSQALLDEQAILSVMAYVDLNPVRASMAGGLEDSHFTSIFERLQQQGLVKPIKPKNKVRKDQTKKGINQAKSASHQAGGFEFKKSFKPEHQLKTLPRAALMGFDDRGEIENAIPFSFGDYIEFVEYMGRAIHPSKSGFIADKQPQIMQSLGISLKLLEISQGGLLRSFGSSIGRVESLDKVRQHKQRAFLQGARVAKLIFG